MRKIAILTVSILAVTACENVAEPGLSGPDGALFTQAAIACQPAGATGLTAVYVNESVVGATIDFADHACDMAIYFDADAPAGAEVRNTSIIQETGAGGSSTGVWNNGGAVTVSHSRFTTDVTGQYLPIRFDNGATGTIASNELIGTHRVAIMMRGAGTDVDVRRNAITGSGAKTAGWAENGIQIDQGATGTVVNNTIEGHWWDGESNWASTAILLFGANEVAVTNNVLTDNEFSIYVYDSHGNRVTGNRTSSEIVSGSTLGFRAWGLLVYGSDNQFSGNHLTSVDGAAGIYIFAGSESNRFTGNRIDGFQWPIVDGGDDTVIRGKPAAVLSF